MSALLLEHIAGGAKSAVCLGSCLAFVFMIQLVTGCLLMLHYSPADSTAWGSVYFIQYEMDFGWLIRGLHHFGSQTMVVLLGLHMLQVVIAGAQTAAARVQLVVRHGSHGHRAGPEFDRLSVALGPKGLLCDHRGDEHPGRRSLVGVSANNCRRRPGVSAITR